MDRQRWSFRDGMARLGAAVNVVTSDGVAGKVGFTATAVCSVTDTPPQLIVCMNRKSAQNETFKRNGVLCVNTLTCEHEDLSTLFAGAAGEMGTARFRPEAWIEGRTGAPILKDALVSFDCAISSTMEAGTHSVFVCDVVDVVATDGGSLIYFGRAYHRLPSIAASRETRGAALTAGFGGAYAKRN